MKILIAKFGVRPENLHFHKIPGDANATGLWISFSVATVLRGSSQAIRISITGHWREMHILGPQLRLSESETQRWVFIQQDQQKP